MSGEYSSGDRPELLKGSAQFEAVEHGLLPVLSRFRYYYHNEGRSPGIEAMAILEALRRTRTDVEAGTLLRQRAIRLFRGQISSRSHHPAESANRRLVDELYRALHGVVRPDQESLPAFHRIEQDSVSYASFAGKDLAYDPDALEFPVAPFGTASLRDVRDRLSGVQLQLGRQIYANFWIENMQTPVEIHRATVDLLIQPEVVEDYRLSQ